MCGEAAGSLAGPGSVSILHPAQAQMVCRFERVSFPFFSHLHSHSQCIIRSTEGCYFPWLWLSLTRSWSICLRSLPVFLTTVPTLWFAVTDRSFFFSLIYTYPPAGLNSRNRRLMLLWLFVHVRLLVSVHLSLFFFSIFFCLLFSACLLHWLLLMFSLVSLPLPLSLSLLETSSSFYPLYISPHSLYSFSPSSFTHVDLTL